MTVERRERIFNTRDRNKGKERPERPVRKSFVYFSDYAPGPDPDGYTFFHYAPCTYYCKALRLFINATGGGKIQLRVNDDEYIEREIQEGENVFQVERIIPSGTRIRLRFIEDTRAVGIWVAWSGEVEA